MRGRCIDHAKMNAKRTERIQAIVELFIAGKTLLSHTVSMYQERGWSLSIRSIHYDRQAALEYMKKEISGRDNKRFFAEAIIRLEHIYAKALEKGDLKSAISVLKEIDILTGLK